MYVFHYLSDHELTPTLDHEHTDFGYYQKRRTTRRHLLFKEIFKMKKTLTSYTLINGKEKF